MGMDPTVVSVLVSGLLFVVGTYLGRPPRQEVLIKFWGTNKDVQRMLEREVAGASRTR
ncbi:MAG: hypothetical protein ACRDO8_03240 [Nocardioidaceae bacterium]